MRRGRVYVWSAAATTALGGSLRTEIVDLLGLDLGEPLRLRGTHVWVRNDGSFAERGAHFQTPRSATIGDAHANAEGDFLFEPGRGGGRMDKNLNPTERFIQRYVQAARFAEVNAYYHIDKVARMLAALLDSLAARPLPRIGVVVNAHDSLSKCAGVCDGVAGTRRWLPFQGGHYRLSQRRYGPVEHRPIAADGEIHLGPGWRILSHGALVEHAGSRYRANAAHNAGILYHEYGHHLSRHTADFQGNRLRSGERQTNLKCAIDEGTADYLAAAMLGTPHIWAFHQRHDAEQQHARSLSRVRSMEDYDASDTADPHSNGSIWGSALWRLRLRLLHAGHCEQTANRLVVEALLLVGELWRTEPKRLLRELWNSPRAFRAGLSALLDAERRLHGGQARALILQVFAEQRIFPDDEATVALRRAARSPFAANQRIEMCG